MMPGNFTEDIETLLDAFGQELGVVPGALRRFGRKSLGYLGASDGAAGVQWNAWLDAREAAAFLGVNLEGMAYDGWPVARFIERELDRPRLFDVRDQLEAPALVQVIWHRDAWQVSLRPEIVEKHIGVSQQMLPAIEPAAWAETLREAYACLDADRSHRARATQTVTTAKGARGERPVSPHLQFRQRISWSPAHGWKTAVAEARRNLRPLYAWVAEQSAA
jgi:hypothetical protein